MPRLRLLTYNVHGLRAGARRVAEAIADERPDVILMNECGWLGRRLRRFAEHFGMEATAGVRLFRPVTNAVLVRPPWRILQSQKREFTRTKRLRRRGVVTARVAHAGFRFTAASVHLGLSDPERVRHAGELTDFLAGLPPPHVLGGDFNEGPEGAAAAWISKRLWDAFAVAGDGAGETFPSHSPRARIDYLFVSNGITVERCWVGKASNQLEASDHLPLFADVTVNE
jgi:endonuclease/exonuclease/phosphatase family metal-dependent hydrolase